MTHHLCLFCSGGRFAHHIHRYECDCDGERRLYTTCISAHLEHPMGPNQSGRASKQTAQGWPRSHSSDHLLRLGFFFSLPSVDGRFVNWESNHPSNQTRVYTSRLRENERRKTRTALKNLVFLVGHGVTS